MRVALYWAPALHDPLWRAGCDWLGRDAETGATCKQPDLPGIAAVTADARRYGFHATLRPPMRLAAGWGAFEATARDIARSIEPFDLPPLEVAAIGGFLALRETAPCAALHDLAATCVALTNHLRLAPDAAELARRRAATLSPRQEELLLRYGYPYVMDAWFFHLTLTGRLDDAERAALHRAAATHFESVLAIPRRVEDICIFTQTDGDMLIAARLPLGRGGESALVGARQGEK